MHRSGITSDAELTDQQRQARVGLAPAKGHRVGWETGVQQTVRIEFPSRGAERMNGLKFAEGDAEHASSNTQSPAMPIARRRPNARVRQGLAGRS